MIAKAIEKLQTLVSPTINDSKPGFVLSDRPLTEYDNRPAQTAAISVSTLSALVDLIYANLNDLVVTNALVQVVDHTKVYLASRLADEYGRRMYHIAAEMPKLAGFKFGEWHDHESFLIGVMANFTADGDREYLLRIASNLTNEHVATSADDGITQTVGMKKGVALKTTETLKQRVTLAPFRTFREVPQPSSEFVFRVRQEQDGVPTLALFEADGGKWRIDAAAAVRDWLKGKITNIPVVA